MTNELQSRPFRFLQPISNVLIDCLTADEEEETVQSPSKWTKCSLSSSTSIHPPWTEFIDNSKRIYIPHKLKCGVTIQVGEGVLEECPSVLEDLNHDLMECLLVLPFSVRGLVRRTKIWLNRCYEYGPVDNPKSVKHTTAHHFSGWLLW